MHNYVHQLFFFSKTKLIISSVRVNVNFLQLLHSQSNYFVLLTIGTQFKLPDEIQKIIRAITFSPPLTRSEFLFRSLGILRIHEINV